jgi:hypothetical protein
MAAAAAADDDDGLLRCFKSRARRARACVHQHWPFFRRGSFGNLFGAF